MINKIVVLLVLAGAGCLFVPAAHAQATANTDSQSVSDQDIPAIASGHPVAGKGADRHELDTYGCGSH
jgi:hypothetical protein